MTYHEMIRHFDVRVGAVDGRRADGYAGVRAIRISLAECRRRRVASSEVKPRPRCLNSVAKAQRGSVSPIVSYLVPLPPLDIIYSFDVFTGSFAGLRLSAASCHWRESALQRQLSGT